MEDLIFRLEALYNGRSTTEQDLIKRLRFNNLKNANINDVLDKLDELRIRIDEVEYLIPIEKINELRTKLNLNI